MRILWLTDIHWDYMSAQDQSKFLDRVAQQSLSCSLIVISGDLGHSLNLKNMLKALRATITNPVYFVLGNHDYHYSSVEAVRRSTSLLCKELADVFWLSEAHAISLSPDLFLAGADTWADGRYGDYKNSLVEMQDWIHIQELREASAIGRTQLHKALQFLADQESDCLEKKIQKSLEYGSHPKVFLILMHVPPFPQVCLYEGQPGSHQYLPFFASKSNGDMLLRVALQYPHIQFVTLCGHAHHIAFYQPQRNLCVRSGAASYEASCVGEALDFSQSF